MNLPALSQDTFEAWQAALDPDDVHDFYYTHNGTDRLARFVCALDRLIIAGARQGGRRGTEIQAYAEAFEVPLEEAAKKYRTALNHDAVKDLLARLRGRETAIFWLGIEQKFGQLVTELLDTALEPGTDIETKTLAVRAAVEFKKGVQVEQAEERKQRSRKAAERARQARDEQDRGQLTVDKARQALKIIIHEYPDEFNRLVAETQSEADGQQKPIRLPAGRSTEAD